MFLFMNDVQFFSLDFFFLSNEIINDEVLLLFHFWTASLLIDFTVDLNPIQFSSKNALPLKEYCVT